VLRRVLRVQGAACARALVCERVCARAMCVSVCVSVRARARVCVCVCVRACDCVCGDRGMIVPRGGETMASASSAEPAAGSSYEHSEIHEVTICRVAPLLMPTRSRQKKFEVLIGLR
jgi:hypothetical protein